MKRYIISFIIVGSIFLNTNLLSAELSTDALIREEKKGPPILKDPLIAGLLSVQFPGLGQIYCQKYLRGLSYLSCEIGCFITAAAIAGYEVKEYKYIVEDIAGNKFELTVNEEITKWDTLSGIEKTAVVSLIIGGIGLHIWNVMDAYHLAQRHNQRLGWIRNIDVQLGFEDETPTLKVAVSKKF